MQQRAGRISFEDKALIKEAIDEKIRLRNIAKRIHKIPVKWRKIDGSLDLDKVHLSLQDYQK